MCLNFAVLPLSSFRDANNLIKRFYQNRVIISVNSDRVRFDIKLGACIATLRKFRLAIVDLLAEISEKALLTVV